ncbi:hypothetical protein [Gordonia alkanivorans]|uniref:hypothetical protein n=1 Tax=Gordonia alkanivorans TaxID=84096 RepID=UPI0004B377E1|nr:hypothetical protein [Gordonia alkanivorans]
MSTCSYCKTETSTVSGRHRHRLTTTTRASRVATAAMAVAVAASLGAGVANAVPEQGGTNPGSGPEQGGTNPGGSGPEQGGTAPTPAPNWSGPGTIPDPPSEAPPVAWSPPPVYNTPYTPRSVPIAPIVVRPAPPVNPIKPPPDMIRVGNFITDIPPGMSDSDVRSVNRWAAYGEAKIAQALISSGVPEDEATRQAAATIIGVGLGGAAGATMVGLPAAGIGIAIGAPVGAIIGGVLGAGGIAPVTATLVPFLGPAAAVVGPPVAVAGGAAIGALAGGAIGGGLLGAAGAIIGAALGGTAGGAVAFTLGAGDPSSTPGSPTDPGDRENDPGYTLPVPNAEADQYVLVVGNEEQKLPGGTSARYVVTKSGDVKGSVTVNGTEMPFGWSAAQADAPFQQLGFFSQTSRDAATSWAYTTGRQLIPQIPGLAISFPQSVRPGETAPTDGSLGQAESDRQKRLQTVRDQARADDDSTSTSAPPPTPAPVPAPMAPAPIPAVAPTWKAPSVAAHVPDQAPAPMKAAATEIDKALHGFGLR